MKTFYAILFAVMLYLPTQAQQTVSGWYNVGAEFDGIGIDTDYFLTHIFPDSTVYVEYSNGLGTVWMHGLGQILDPKYSFFDFGFVQSLNEYTPYTLDSIDIPYRYFRFQDNAPDTLIIQIFKEENVFQFYEDPWAGDPTYGGRSYARIAYDSGVRRGSDPYMEIVELLDNNDSTSVKSSITVPVGAQIAAGEVVAATVTYLPGNPFNVGDTLDAEYIPKPGNQINDFIMNYYLDNSLTYETGLYNHALIATDDSRYDLTANSWNGQYWPGIASGGGLYHADLNFHLSATVVPPPVGISELNSSLIASVFPNPAHESAQLQIKLEESQDLEITLSDATGKFVKLIDRKNYPAGSSRIRIATEELSSGLYFCRISNGSGVKVLKLSVY